MLRELSSRSTIIKKFTISSLQADVPETHRAVSYTHLQKQLIVFVYISECSKIFLQELVGFCTWYEYFFFHHITVAVVVINTDTAVSLVNTTVHVTVQYKVHIPVICHSDDLDIMFVAHISGIVIFLFAEAEDPCDLSAGRCIRPEIPILLLSLIHI